MSTMDEMVVSAQEAEQELRKLVSENPDMSAKQVAAWMRKWYLKAGYKRLSKIMLDIFK